MPRVKAGVRLGFRQMPCLLMPKFCINNLHHVFTQRHQVLSVDLPPPSLILTLESAVSDSGALQLLACRLVPAAMVPPLPLAGEVLAYVQGLPKGQHDRACAVCKLPVHQRVLVDDYRKRGVHMFFKKKPKPPLEDAIRMVQDAIEIAYKPLRDKKYMPTEAELEHFERLANTLWENYTTTQYISRCLHQRYNGEPERSRKFTNPKTFDWHYPR